MSSDNGRGIIRLPIEQDDQHSLFSRSTLRWSIPCCSSVQLLNTRSRAIQLSEDSDVECEDHYPEEFIIPTEITTYSENKARARQIFLQHQNRNYLPIHLFVEADASHIQNRYEGNAHLEEEHQHDFVKNVHQQTLHLGEEELVGLNQTALRKYNLESDDTESGDSFKFKLCSDKDDSSLTNLQSLSYVKTTPPLEMIIPNDNKSQRRSIIDSKAPQIEETVLHHLPLPRLSQEIPQNMIHQKLLFDNSINDSDLLTSTTQVIGDKSSKLFPKTEERILACNSKDDKEEQQIVIEDKIKIGSKVAIVEQVQDLGTSTSISLESSKKEELLSSNQRILVASKPTMNDNEKSSNVEKKERKLSIVATAAQSILGDKLEDFTEKLAFIKKTIIMNIDSSDDEDELMSPENQKKKINNNNLVKNTNSCNSESNLEQHLSVVTARKRTGSIIDVAPTITKLINQIGNSLNISEDRSPARILPSSHSSELSSFSPSSLFTAFAGSPTSAISKKTQEEKKKDIIKEEEEEEDKELFDFTKVIEIGKNVRHFSEGFVENGFRIFSDVATRVKTSVDIKEPDYILKQENSSTSTISSMNNDEAWMHNYL
ncbi:uncharacterized protein BX663DRAFT_510359 [Cokeromyces recurvatus]|uniref:uncharacterized protein n=1 Tax=Cokeromyces recurvatus TaxID=90255 RepID=UPI00222015BA|nr:uncharacterized protein BX663DRAFT_510359 [Cokeromyces recurvatus]KAI7902745.1 hypothetical protein BX663DRAFT_510359 [Cokeromyces recurvatus]